MLSQSQKTRSKCSHVSTAIPKSLSFSSAVASGRRVTTSRCSLLTRPVTCFASAETGPMIRSTIHTLGRHRHHSSGRFCRTCRNPLSQQQGLAARSQLVCRITQALPTPFSPQSCTPSARWLHACEIASDVCIWCSVARHMGQSCDATGSRAQRLRLRKVQLDGTSHHLQHLWIPGPQSGSILWMQAL